MGQRQLQWMGTGQAVLQRSHRRAAVRINTHQCHPQGAIAIQHGLQRATPARGRVTGSSVKGLELIQNDLTSLDPTLHGSWLLELRLAGTAAQPDHP